MKKLLLSAAALCCFMSAHAQWTTTSGTAATSASGDIIRSGNVGIGSTAPGAPGAKLDVFETTGPGGGVDDYRILKRVGSSAGTANIVHQNLWARRDAVGNSWITYRLRDGISVDVSFTTPTTSRSWWERDPYNAIQEWGDGATTYMTLAGGSLGIGTASPGYKLDVVGRARFQAGNGSAGAWFNNSANTSIRAFVGMVDDNVVGFYGQGNSNWGFKMDVSTSNIDMNGNVTVGTPAPSGTQGNYKLSVWGRARANEIVVNTTGADFVFAKDYRLRPLGEVEQFIATNQHLPEIPSAQEMQANGMAVGELQTRLLQKVEELTLYVIEQHKKIEAQQKEAVAQARKMEELEQQLAAGKK
jgi:hypothetical protein